VTLGVAVIGCGLIGAKRALAAPDGMSVRSLYDPVDDRAAQLAGRLDGDPVVATSIDEAVGHDGVDLVIVATSHDALASSAMTALDAGRHVLIEKPGARHADELTPVVAAASVADRTVRVGFNHRFHPSFAELRHVVASEDVGPLMHVRARYGHGGRVGYDREWRADRARSGGGELLDQGVHLIDLTRSICGEVDLAFAELRTDFWDMEVEDNAFIALRCTPGFAWLHASWTEWRNVFSFEVAFRRVKFEVSGLGGSYGLEQLAIHRMRPELGPPDTVVHEFRRGDDSWHDELVDVMAAIAGRPTVGADVSDAVAALSIIGEAYDR
jgi:predicted dehydrogenase